MSDLGSQASIDEVYEERNECVALLLTLADRLHYPTWYANGDDPLWPVVFIDLPHAGQVSWHIPLNQFNEFFPRPEHHEARWDHHNNVEKSARVVGEALSTF